MANLFYPTSLICRPAIFLVVFIVTPHLYEVVEHAAPHENQHASAHNLLFHQKQRLHHSNFMLYLY
jgi:hypothetical protein